jgi:hypothetical protein
MATEVQRAVVSDRDVPDIPRSAQVPGGWPKTGRWRRPRPIIDAGYSKP